MSKASKNTTKGRQGNAAKLATMRHLISELTAARETFIAASAEFGNIEAVYMKAAPTRPEYGREMPADVREAFETLTVGQLAVIPENHPYKVWQRDCGATADAEHNAKRRAYDDECNAIKARLGYDKADSAVTRASKRIDRLYRQIQAINAEGLEAIALKVLAYRLTEFEAKDPADVAELFATIDATAAKAGFNTRAKPVAK